jgi:hypothetical protein
MITLTWYNPELTAAEKNRRLSFLDPGTVEEGIEYLRMLQTSPWPQSWHIDDDVGMTNDEWDSTFYNFSRSRDRIAAQLIHDLYVRRRRQIAPEYWFQERCKWASEFTAELEIIKKNNAWAGKLFDARYELSQAEEAIKREERCLAARRKKLEDNIQDEPNKLGNAIFDLRVNWGTDPNSIDHWRGLIINPTFVQEAQQIRAESAVRLVQWKRDLSVLNQAGAVALKQLQSERDMAAKKVSWHFDANRFLEAAKNRAIKKLAKLESMQAKDYLELFPPTCIQPEPVPVPDLNAEIMKALTALRSEHSPAEQVSLLETNGEFHEDVTSAFSKGINSKNPLGVRGVDAVQVSSRRGPPTDRPPDPPPRVVSVWGMLTGEGEHHPVPTLPTCVFLVSGSEFERQVRALCSNCKIWGAEAIRLLQGSFASWILSRSQSGAELDASEVWSVQG